MTGIQGFVIDMSMALAQKNYQRKKDRNFKVMTDETSSLKLALNELKAPHNSKEYTVYTKLKHFIPGTIWPLNLVFVEFIQ